MTADSPRQSVAAACDRLAEEFLDVEPRQRLELLLESAERLPPLPAKYRAERDAGLHRVHECQSPVFLWIELDAQQRVTLYADVAPTAPTVKGFVSLLSEVLSGAPAAEALTLEPSFVHRLGLAAALGMVRMRGLNAILFAVHKRLEQALAATPG